MAASPQREPDASRHTLLRSFQNAFRGCLCAVRVGRNMRIHLSVLGLVVFFGAVGRIEAWAWAAVLLCVALVLCAEAFNTALERLCDRVSTARESVIRDVKDMAAGAVLVCAVGAAAVGLLVFCRSAVLYAVAAAFSSLPALGVALAALLAGIFLFVRGKTI